MTTEATSIDLRSLPGPSPNGSSPSIDLRSLPGYTSSRLAFYGMAEQALAGVQFDKEAAEALVVRIDGLMKQIEEEVEPKLPARGLKKSEQALYTLPAKPYKKDGTLAASMLKWVEKLRALELEVSITESQDAVQWIDGEVYPIIGNKELPATMPMKLANQDQIKEYLLEEGWSPTLWNFKKDKRGKPVRDDRGKLIRTSPKFQENKKLCANLEAMSGPIISQIVMWLSLRNRRSTLASTTNEETGWLNNDRLEFDGRLSAGAAGFTNTFRFKGSVVVNVPKAEEGVTLGKEMRALFTARPGNVLVGFDASALENRVEAHYCYPYEGGKEYADEILNGDPHYKNAFVFYPEHLAKLGFKFGEVSKDDPQFKPYRSRAKNGRYCVPMHTRCLVRWKGWRGYDEVEEGDEVLGYCPEKRIKTWTRVVGKVYYPEAEVFEIKNKWWKVQATNDHRWFVRQRHWTRNGNPNFSMASATYKEKTTIQLTKESNIIVNAPMVEDCLSSIGWYGNMPHKRHCDWTQRVLDMGQNERQAFLEGFCIADGHTNADGSWAWTQNRGDLFEAALLASYLVHDGVLRCSTQEGTNSLISTVKLSKKAHVTCQTMKKESLGVMPVWCLQTELGSWVMRQEDVITITGNCLSYGGGPPKLATTLQLPASQGEQLYEAFWEANYPLKKFRDVLTQFWETTGEKKWIRGIDGRRVPTRSKHSVVNTAFQSTGACVMEIADLFMCKQLGGWQLDEQGSPCFKYKGHNVYRVIFQHDEFEYDCPPDVADEIGKMGCDAITKAGQYLKMRVPLGGSYSVGLTWRDVH